MDKSIQSIEINKIFCKYCKRNFLLAGLNYETQICYQCEEVFDRFSSSPQLIDGKNINNKERNFLILKTIILGDVFSNKTELFKNYVNSYLNHSYQQTIGLDIAGKDIYHNNRQVRVTISIISHLPRFKVIRHEFYSGTNIAFLVFNAESSDSIKEVEKVRRRGWALDDEEIIEGIRCISAPIYDYRNTVIAAVSTSYEIAVNKDADIEKISQWVMSAASEISKRMGGPRSRQAVNYAELY